MCNRLWSAASWISYCNSNNYYLIWMGFYEYCNNFKLDNKNIYVLYGFWPNLLNMYISKFCVFMCRKLFSFDTGFGFFKIIYTEKSIDCFENSRRGILILEAWPSRKPVHSLTYGHDYISSLFEVRFPPLLAWSSEARLKIGIHVRKGDYKNFKDGIFYYENEIYIENALRLIDELHIDRQAVNFFISSNCNHSKFYIKNQLPFHVLTINNGTAIDDLFALSQCDYIFGPPSSFSCWAAYMGKSKLAFISRSQDRLSLNDFRGINSDDVRDECRSRVGYWWP